MKSFSQKGSFFEVNLSGWARFVERSGILEGETADQTKRKVVINGGDCFDLESGLAMTMVKEKGVGVGGLGTVPVGDLRSEAKSPKNTKYSKGDPPTERGYIKEKKSGWADLRSEAKSPKGKPPTKQKEKR